MTLPRASPMAAPSLRPGQCRRSQSGAVRATRWRSASPQFECSWFRSLQQMDACRGFLASDGGIQFLNWSCLKRPIRYSGHHEPVARGQDASARTAERLGDDRRDGILGVGGPNTPADRRRPHHPRRATSLRTRSRRRPRRESHDRQFRVLGASGGGYLERGRDPAVSPRFRVGRPSFPLLAPATSSTSVGRPARRHRVRTLRLR